MSGSALTLRDSTVSGNEAGLAGGGIFAWGTLRAANLTVSGNRADHGGPTPTHLPLPGSPAVDLGGTGCAGRDQRGAPRPADGDGDGQARCDSGAAEVSAACVAGATDLCLRGGRFRATATWQTAGARGPARALPFTHDTGAFWFFAAENLEITVKVLDACALNGRYWVFLSGLTDVGVEVRVEDTATGRTWTHVHTAGTPLQPRLDTDALECVNPGQNRALQRSSQKEKSP